MSRRILAADRYKSLLIYDANGTIEYPILQYEVYEQAGELTAPFQRELKGDFEEAIKQYGKIADDTSDEIISHHGVLDSGIELIQKPIDSVVLVRTIRDVLNG